MFDKILVIGIFVLTSLLFSFMTRVEKISLDKENKKIAGVCAGLSRVSSMPVLAIRIFFIGVSFFLGFGIIFYFSLWVFMLKEKKEPASQIVTEEEEKN